VAAIGLWNQRSCEARGLDLPDFGPIFAAEATVAEPSNNKLA
jgi:hypothetical protein